MVPRPTELGIQQPEKRISVASMHVFFEEHAPSQLSRYRDYLRTIYTGPPVDEPGRDGRYAEGLAKLEARFHQFFETLDSDLVPANSLVVEIMRRTLTAPRDDGHGFGFSEEDIPPQGARSARAYLDELIGLTEKTARELSLRYRLRLDRTDDALSSPVLENVFTLQRFFSDGFPGDVEPFPIIPDGLEGRAPFFLYFEEWSAQNQPFFGENFYQLRHTFSVRVHETKKFSPEVIASANASAAVVWVSKLCDLEDLVERAHERFDQGQFAMAADLYRQASARGHVLHILHTIPPELPDAQWRPKRDPFEVRARAHLDRLNRLKVNAPADLSDLVAMYVPPRFYASDDAPIDPSEAADEFEFWYELADVPLWFGLMHLLTDVLPACLGDIALAQGDLGAALDAYRSGTRTLIGRAALDSRAGYPLGADTIYRTVGFPNEVDSIENTHFHTGEADRASYSGPTLNAGPKGFFYENGSLPYTVDRSARSLPHYVGPFWATSRHEPSVFWDVLAARHPMERAFFGLRQANAMLEWADSLYRTDEPANVQRARELYKDVLWVHGEKHHVSPTWDRPVKLVLGARNPAKVSQQQRARVGLLQIEAGLNYYGFTDAHVPALRFRTLKEASDRFASAARSAQQDFLLFMGKTEEMLRESLVTNNMLRKANLQGQIAGEQAEIARFGVTLAQRQIDQINAAIDAKEKEIAEHEELFTQFSDMIGGMADVVKGVGADKVAGGAQAGAGLSQSGAAGSASVAGGTAVLGGFALFAYAGYMSLSNMADASDRRAGELNALQQDALPLARAQLRTKQREVTIAEYQQQIARADADLAKDLLEFASTRFLNARYWSELSAVMKRVMRRYLILGARYGWLAERALAYEQDRAIDIIRFDYIPTRLQGVTGADLLQMDFAELDAARLEGIKQTVPVKRTYSLAFDFPLKFAQLKKTGRCTFMTDEAAFQEAYPGTYGYRVRALTPAIKSYAGSPPVRGMLTNVGVSRLSRSDGETRALLRDPDACPITEFRLAADMDVYGLPDEALLNFEGSGLDTTWGLEFSSLANEFGLNSVADIEITFDMRAHYSPQLHAQHLKEAGAKKSVRRFVFISAAGQSPEVVADLHGKAPTTTVTFDMRRVPLPEAQRNRKVTNLVVFLAGGGSLSARATLATQATAPVEVQLEHGFAVSRAEPFIVASQSNGDEPALNQFVGAEVAEAYSMTIDKRANAGTSFADVSDVVLGIEFTAQTGE